MGIVIVFFASLLIGIFLHYFFRKTLVTVLSPAILLTLLVIIEAYVLPYSRGGASMWPIAVFFGVPAALGGSFIAAMIMETLLMDEKKQGEDANKH